MTRRIAWLLGVSFASLAAQGSLAVSVTAEGTSISKISENGTIVLVGTGSGAGECRVDADRIACFDGANLATAVLGQGCLGTEGSGFCLVAPADGLNVSAAGSGTDITCATGLKKGRIYVMTDGDGTGSCGPNRDVDGKINGAVCTKRGAECAAMDCDEGCGSVSSGCECHERSPRTSPVVNDPIE